MRHRLMYLARVTGAAALLLTAAALVCCSKADPSKTVIVFSYDEGGEIKEKIIDDLIAEFEKLNPSLRVRKHPLPGVTDMERAFYLSSFAAQSTFVDVFESDVIWTSEFAAGGFLLPLDEYVTEEMRKQWIAPAIAEATYAGKLYAVPYYMTYAALFYRPDLMKKYNFDLPATWEELVEQARTIGDKEGIHGLLFQGEKYEGLVCNFLQFYHNLGGEIRITDERVVFDEPVLGETLALLRGLLHDSKVTPDDVLEHLGEDSDRLFGKGKAAFMINTQAAAMYVREGKIGENFALAPMPGKGIALTGGFHLAINRRSGNPAAAFKFASFMAGEASQKRFLVDRGHGPVLSKLYAGVPEGIPQLAALKELSRTTRMRPKSPYYHNFSLMLAEEVHAVLDDDKTAAEGTQSILRRARELDFPKEAPPEFPKEFIHWQ